MRYDEKVIEIRKHTDSYAKKRFKGEDPRTFDQFLAWVLDYYGTGEMAVRKKLESLKVTPEELNAARQKEEPKNE